MSEEARKINHTIVGYSVKDANAPNQEVGEGKASAASNPALPEKQTMNEAIERPELLIGSTYKIKPAGSDHALYITINDFILNQDTEHEQRQPFEIFINSKNMEQFQWVVALTRILSAVFRKGGDVTFLVDELKAVFDPRGGYWKPGTGVFVPSVIAEIGMVIEDHLKRIVLLKSEELSSSTKALIESKKKQLDLKATSATNPESGFPPNASLCDKCHTKAVVMMDGCATCLNCGYSKCG